MSAAYAVVGPVLAIGDPTSVKAVIDTGGKTGLNTNAQFQEAEASVTGDRLGFAYADLATLAKSATDLAGTVTGAMPSLPISLEGLTPPWVAGAVRAEDGAFVMESRSPHLAAAGPATNAESKLPGVLPPTTVFLAEGHDVGKTITSVKDQLAQVPELKEPIDQLDDALAIVGGSEADHRLDRRGRRGGHPRRRRTSPAASSSSRTMPPRPSKLLSQLKAFIQLGGAQAGLSVTEEDYKGTTITVIDLSGLAGLAGGMTACRLAGARRPQARLRRDRPGRRPRHRDRLREERARRERRRVPRRHRALQHGARRRPGKEHSALFWLDVAAIRGFVEGMVPTSDRADYDANAQAIPRGVRYRDRHRRSRVTRSTPAP